MSLSLLLMLAGLLLILSLLVTLAIIGYSYFDTRPQESSYEGERQTTQGGLKDFLRSQRR